VFALGLIFGVSTCGGPIVPFRGGRVDVWKAGITGTPEPHQDIQTHLSQFSRAGFNQQEMIQMVACGHTLGGVRSTDFPQLVDPGANAATPVFANFVDGTQFNNHV
jgi:catalase (peroxidase I)